MMIFTGCIGVWGDLRFGVFGSEFGLRDEAFKFLPEIHLGNAVGTGISGGSFGDFLNTNQAGLGFRV